MIRPGPARGGPLSLERSFLAKIKQKLPGKKSRCRSSHQLINFLESLLIKPRARGIFYYCAVVAQRCPDLFIASRYNRPRSTGPNPWMAEGSVYAPFLPPGAPGHKARFATLRPKPGGTGKNSPMPSVEVKAHSGRNGSNVGCKSQNIKELGEGPHATNWEVLAHYPGFAGMGFLKCIRMFGQRHEALSGTDVFSMWVAKYMLLVSVTV